MSSFTCLLLVSPVDDGANWVLMRDFCYITNGFFTANREKYAIHVPYGFVTDFASIPRVLWSIFPKWGKYGNAAIVHDWLYWDQSVPKEKADLIFYKAMTTLGVGNWQKRLMYYAVARFGSHAWTKNQLDKKQGRRKVLTPQELDKIKIGSVHVDIREGIEGIGSQNND